MRRVVVVIPHLLSADEGSSVLSQPLRALTQFAERSQLLKLQALPEDAEPCDDTPARCKTFRAAVTPESAFLGLDPERYVIQDGPLTVSALGADPPSNSVHFHLSLLSLQDGVASPVLVSVPDQHVSAVISAARKLNTKLLTVVEGAELNHGLVWEEGSIDLGTAHAACIEGKSINPYLPEGDGEPMLRRFIDDSVNLLTELPLNREREEEGLPALNLLWPWGQGFRELLPNLAIRRGTVGRVESSSMRLHGLARLVGYRSGDYRTFGKAVRVNFAQVLSAIKSSTSTVVLLDAFSALSEPARPDQLEWLASTMDSELFQPLWQLAQQEGLSFALVAPGGSTGMAPARASRVGLALNFDSREVISNNTPFDERALDDRRLALEHTHRVVDEKLTESD